MKRWVLLWVLLVAVSVRADEDGSLQVITVENAAEVVELYSFSFDENSRVLDLDFSSDNALLSIVNATRSSVFGWTGQLAMWHLSDFQPLQIPVYSAFNVSSVAFSSNEPILMAGSFDGSGYLFDTNTHMLLENYSITTHQINDLMFSPDGEFVGFAGASIPASPDMPRILPDDLRTLHVINVAIAQSVLSWKPLDEMSNWGGGSTVAFSRDSQYVALGQSGNVVSVWNLNTHHQVDLIGGGTGGVNSVLFPHVDGIIIVMYGDGKIVTWNIKTQEQIHSFEGSNTWFGQLLMTDDEQLLITADGNGQILFLDSQNGDEVHRLNAHQTSVQRLAFSPDGTMLASGGADGTVRLWGVPADE